MKNKIASAVVVIIFLLTACSKDYFAPPPVLDLKTPVSFKKEIIPIFEANCYGAGCQTKGQTPDLTATNAYDQLNMLGYVDTLNAEQCKLYLRVIATVKPMPPKGKLPGETTNKILAWIKQGALNN